MADDNDPAGMHNVLALLDVDVTYPGWEHEIGSRKAYYVRGFSWFRDKVLNDHLFVTECGSYIPEMKKLLSKRRGWTSLPFGWKDDFSIRQFIDTASRYRKLTPKFHKAAEVILLCEVIARDIHSRDPRRPAPEEVYRRMRIEPAVSYVHGFDRSVIERLSPTDLDLLRRWTGQPGNEVFFDLAGGHTVTHKLALRVREFFTIRLTDVPLGDVGFRFRGKNYRLGPSSNEFVDVDTRELPEVSTLRLPRSTGQSATGSD